MKKILLTFFAFHGFLLQKRNHHKVHYMLMVKKGGKSVKDKVYESCMYGVDMYGGWEEFLYHIVQLLLY